MGVKGFKTNINMKELPDTIINVLDDSEFEKYINELMKKFFNETVKRANKEAILTLVKMAKAWEIVNKYFIVKLYGKYLRVGEELEDLLFSLKVEEQINPRNKKVKKQKDAIETAIENIKVLGAIKNSLSIEYKPIPVPEAKVGMFVSDYVTQVTEYAVKVEQRRRNQKITEALTKWIIKNIDKNKVKEWLKDE